MKTFLLCTPYLSAAPLSRRLPPLLAGCVALLLLTSLRAGAQTPVAAEALDFTSLGNGFDYTQGSYSLGWRFRAQHDIIVTDLGFYDDSQNGLTQSHPVGIFDAETKQLVVSTTVTPADPLTGSFRYHAITPVTLTGGRDYYAMAVTGTELYAVGVTDVMLNRAITYVAGVVDYSTSAATQLSPPTDETRNFHGDYGPSFKIADANPQSAAVDMPELTGADANEAPFSMGYLFRPRQDVKVSTLGYYDDNGDGFRQGSHQVTIYDAVEKQVVAGAVVYGNDPLRGFFRYHQVNGVTLLAGHDYFVMGDNVYDNYRRDVTSLAVTPLIELRGSAFNNQPPSFGAAFPTESHPGDAPFFGPTFEVGGPPQPLNISTRANVQNGNSVMIGGFIVTGSEQKKLMVRAIGPSLPIVGKLADPTLELFNGSDSVAFNNDWKETQQKEIEASGIPPTDDKESAIVATLNPGSYTAVIRGAGDTGGSALVEVYDLSTGAASKLANISTRAFVGGSTTAGKAGVHAETADAPLIGGFIVGSASKYIIRAIGPSLATPELQDVLQDPTLDIYDGNGALIGSNDDWQDSQADEINASGVAPSDSRESAIVADLQSGPYTGVVRGKNGGSGVALVEVYNIE